MVYPNASVECIVIEGSKEGTLKGEYAIDLTEYSKKENGKQIVSYVQLKHSSVNQNKPFTASELKKTIIEFAARFSAFTQNPNLINLVPKFSFISNRKVNKEIKLAFKAVVTEGRLLKKQKALLEDITGLKSTKLKCFADALTFQDDQGDYKLQLHKLHGEVLQLIAGFVQSSETMKLIGVVRDAATSLTGNNALHKEDVWRCLGVNSNRDLFPAQSVMESTKGKIKRIQHQQILEKILSTQEPVIIHAEGGVGKSIAALQIATQLPSGCIGVVYDCFGGGTYRNAATPRHRPCDALIEIANELASKGLCQFLVGHSGTPADALYRAFRERLEQAVRSSREINNEAEILIMVDAADNAEMAARENNDVCFASTLLREELPLNCHLVMLCRTERMELLKPPSNVKLELLHPFNEEESGLHLRGTHSSANIHFVREFHRLTGGNPRVQANALASFHETIESLLVNIGPRQATVDDQISAQLDGAIVRMKDRLTTIDNAQIDSICRGLANLPPFIPLPVLARAADVNVAAIKSFVSDLGRALWHSDGSVQFRDEPTEHWFRSRFSASSSEIENFASTLEPLASTYSYVSKALPALWLRSGNYEKLFSLALSDEGLPSNNPIDKRDIRFYRLQFAFKAALINKSYISAAKLALRATEELPGNTRQHRLLMENTDIVGSLQEAQRVREYAFTQNFPNRWPGAGNAYIACLLSSVKEFHGEAGAYLRSAERLLQSYLHSTKPPGGPEVRDGDLTAYDIVTIGLSKLNIFGVENLIQHMKAWSAGSRGMQAFKLIIRKLIDVGRFDEIHQISLDETVDLRTILILCTELIAIAQFPPKVTLYRGLDELCNTGIGLSESSFAAAEYSLTNCILSFLEACAHYELPSEKICDVIDRYVPPLAGHHLIGKANASGRVQFFRAAALRAFLVEGTMPNSETVLPPALPLKSFERQLNQFELVELKGIFATHSSVFLLRARAIVSRAATLEFAVDLTEMTLREINAPGVEEVLVACLEAAGFNSAIAESIKETHFAETALETMSLGTNILLDIAYLLFRRNHLSFMRNSIERVLSKRLFSPPEEGAEVHANFWVRYARAIFPLSVVDAATCFDAAVEVLSRHGGDRSLGLQAIKSISRRASSEGPLSAEITYRFAKCIGIFGSLDTAAEAWKIILRMHAPSAFAFLARWHDLDRNMVSEAIKMVSNECVRLNLLSAKAAWCLSGFRGAHRSLDLLNICLEGETDLASKLRMIQAAESDLIVNSSRSEYRHELALLANRFGLGCPELSWQQPRTKDDSPSYVAIKHLCWNDPNPKHPEPCEAYRATHTNLQDALHFYHQHPINAISFWQSILDNVLPGQELSFLRNLLCTADASLIDIKDALLLAHQCWGHKVSINFYWAEIAKRIGGRFAIELAEFGSTDDWKRFLPCFDRYLDELREGVIEGLADLSAILGERAFFGFVTVFSEFALVQDAKIALDYAIERFEPYIKEEDGFAFWVKELEPPDNTIDAYAGLIWSALGARDSRVRWEAFHMVRLLVELNCSGEYYSLLTLIDVCEIKAFNIKRNFFFQLDAQQWLLVGTEVGARQNPSFLAPWVNSFVDIALNGKPHYEIQRLAAEVALLIELAIPGVFSGELKEFLRRVGGNPFPSKIVDVSYKINSPWHVDGKLHSSTYLQLPVDFVRYLLFPFARFFAVPVEQVIELVCQAASEIPQVDSTLADLNASTDAGEGLDRENSFLYYRSFHALQQVAAKLLRTLPLVHVNMPADRDIENTWAYWIDSVSPLNR